MVQTVWYGRHDAGLHCIDWRLNVVSSCWLVEFCIIDEYNGVNRNGLQRYQRRRARSTRSRVCWPQRLEKTNHTPGRQRQTAEKDHSLRFPVITLLISVFTLKRVKCYVTGCAKTKQPKNNEVTLTTNCENIAYIDFLIFIADSASSIYHNNVFMLSTDKMDAYVKDQVIFIERKSILETNSKISKHKNNFLDQYVSLV